MAYAVLVSLTQTIDHILNLHQYSISPHQKQQIRSLHEHSVFLQTFLEDFPAKADDGVEGRIRDVSTEAEDIMEHFMSTQIQGHYGLVKRAIVLVKFNYQLNKIAEEIDSIVREVNEIKNSFRIEEARLDDSPSASSPLVRATTGKDVMVGFDKDLLEIKERLCGESKLEIIPVYGMGGIGKTTLARNAYDDPLIIEHFHIRVWVTVSQDYKKQEILSRLLVSLKKRNRERSGKNDEEKVYKSLKGMRYLIVLDDMWTTEVWDDVRKIFPDDSNASRIILTARLRDMATYAGPCSPLHEMSFMDVDQSWDLLSRKMFADQACPRELEGIGKEIARSCRGLPLAIVVIAGLLSASMITLTSWKDIAKFVELAVAAKDGQFEQILSLSYTHLPHHLRPCFLYMGAFLEDQEINISKLIKLWAAEGFLKSCPNGSKSYEEVAEEYLEDLVKRSLVSVERRKPNGRIRNCSIHDLLRSLCIRKAIEEKFFLNMGSSYFMADLLETVKNKHGSRRLHTALLESIKNHTRISISDINILGDMNGSKNIRTILCLASAIDSLSYLGNFILLRVLDVIKVYVYLFPAQVFELFHLRYLAFSYVEEIPPSVSNLENLQTLIIASRSYVQVILPLEIWRMPKLRHLISVFGPLPNLEGPVFALENLQTLSTVTNLTCSKNILRMIQNLKKLGISYSGSNGDYLLENLVLLHQLEKLKLKFERAMIFSGERKSCPVFPKSLKKLTISGGRLAWDHMTEIVGSLPNLEVLKLRDLACEGGKWETEEGNFPQLKFLLIDISHLNEWITEKSHFPRLRCLLLHRCRFLREIPCDIGEIPTLEMIEVRGENESLMESAKRIQEEQQGWGNEALQVRCKKNFYGDDDVDKFHSWRDN